MGFLIKLDTNGSNPKTVRELIECGLVDYIAIDYKAPQKKFFEITRHKKFSNFSETLDVIFRHKNKIDFEVRTTIHSDLLDENDVNEIIFDLEKRGFDKKFFLQNFFGKNPTLGNLPPSKKIDLKKIVKSQQFEIEWRNF
jgi:pyruvate formate lyase activating enzyme